MQTSDINNHLGDYELSTLKPQTQPTPSVTRGSSTSSSLSGVLSSEFFLGNSVFLFCGSIVIVVETRTMNGGCALEGALQELPLAGAPAASEPTGSR